MPEEMIDIEKWIAIAPLEIAEAHLRAAYEEEERIRREWYNNLTEEQKTDQRRVQHLVRDLQEQSFERGMPKFDNLVSPITLAYIEQYRTRHKFDEQGWRSRPVDVIVWALGEPPKRHWTKIGGLPYRPADLVWPTILPDDGPYPAKSGEPMTFLAQINFSESRDLFFPPLPGDVLLVFAEDDTFSRDEALHFEWYRLGIPEENLIAANDVALPAWECVTCHGFYHRTVDYFSDVPEECYYFPRSRAALLDASKIGGIPCLVQSNLEEFESEMHASNKQFLAQIRSLYPPTNQYYPWLNQYEPLSECRKDFTLELSDDGSIYLFIDQEGQISWTIEYA